MNQTIAYYNAHAQEFALDTAGACMEEQYARFLAHVPVGGAILDCGCGSGRDSRYFAHMGYAVTAVDGSRELCRVAGEYTGLKVRWLYFHQLDYTAAFDGIWACASLLHVPGTELVQVLRLVRPLCTMGTQGPLVIGLKYSLEVKYGTAGRLFRKF